MRLTQPSLVFNWLVAELIYVLVQARLLYHLFGLHLHEVLHLLRLTTQQVLLFDVVS